MNRPDQVAFHIYGTGTVEGYKTVRCSESIVPLCREIDRHCMRFGGNRRIEFELESQPLTIAFLSNGHVLMSLWRPSLVPDSRNRPNPMEAASAVFSFDYLQQRGFPLNDIRNLLGQVSREVFPLQPKLKLEDQNLRSGPHLTSVYRFCQIGQYTSNDGFTPGSARWMSLLPPQYRQLNAIISHERFEATRTEGVVTPPLPEKFCAILAEDKFGLQIRRANDWDQFYPAWVKLKRKQKVMRVVNIASKVLLGIAVVVGLTMGYGFFVNYAKKAKSDNTVPATTNVATTEKTAPTDTTKPKSENTIPVTTNATPTTVKTVPADTSKTKELPKQ